jgi:hypothetical protein
MVSQFCDKCQSHEKIIWFKTKDHYLDLKGEQFSEFVQELEKHELTAKYVDDKTLEVLSPKRDIRVRLKCHECGPEIIHGFAGELIKAGIIAVILDALKKLIKKKSKEMGETATYQVYVVQEFNKIEINSFNKEVISAALKKTDNLKQKGNQNKRITSKQKKA